MRKIRSHLRDCRRECLAAAALKLLEAALELAMPFAIAAMIDRGIPSVSAARILRAWLLLAALGLAGLACALSAQYFASRAAARMAANLRRAAFRRALRLGCANLDRSCESTLIERLTADIDEIQAGVELLLPLAPHEPLLLTGAMLAALLIDARCGLIVAAAIVLLLTITFGVPLVIARIRRRFGRQAGDVTPMRFPARVAAGLALIALLVTAAPLADAGALTRGELVALMFCLGLTLPALLGLSELFRAEIRTEAHLRRATAPLSPRPSPRSPAKPALPDPADAGRVDFERACLRRLTDITFSVRRGQIIGVTGDGADMRALLELIPRFSDAESGSVRVGGADARRQNLRALRARIGVVPRRARLFQGSVRDNLRWGDPNASDDVLLEAVRIAQAADALYTAGGLDGQIEPFGGNLSDDQRQRLAVARALARRPEILILDDSDSTLDCAGDARLRLALRRLSCRPTVFIASNRAAAVRHADRILVMDGGRIADFGAHEQLVKRCRIYQKIIDSESQKEASA